MSLSRPSTNSMCVRHTYVHTPLYSQCVHTCMHIHKCVHTFLHNCEHMCSSLHTSKHIPLYMPTSLCTMFILICSCIQVNTHTCEQYSQIDNVYTPAYIPIYIYENLHIAANILLYATIHTCRVFIHLYTQCIYSYMHTYILMYHGYTHLYTPMHILAHVYIPVYMPIYMYNVYISIHMHNVYIPAHTSSNLEIYLHAMCPNLHT